MSKERFDSIVSALGEPYYSDGKRAIYCSDCRELLPRIGPGSVDLVLTDPPYGIGESKKNHASRNNLGISPDYGCSEWDETTQPEAIDLAIRLSRHAIVFGGNYYSLAPSSCWLVWDKDNTGDFADCELAWTNLPKAVRKIRWRWNGMLQENAGANKEPRFHPTQKPLAVMKWAIRHAPEDASLILDPFMGSGTTLRAAKDLDRYAIGIELEERNCLVAKRRLAQSVLEFSET